MYSNHSKIGKITPQTPVPNLQSFFFSFFFSSSPPPTWYKRKEKKKTVLTKEII